MNNIRLSLFMTAFLLISFNSLEAAGLSDKSQYNLFNPTPKEHMREMSTDRPDKTESPYTVDAGHIQLESSLIDYSFDVHNPDGSQEKVEALTITETNMKLGLTNNIDLQVVLSPYIYERTNDDVEKTIKEGFGDIQTRLKINLWGNDEGNTALALMPFIKFPTNQEELGNDAHEGGLIIPLGIALPNDWNMGLMAEFDFNQNANDNDYHTEFIQSVTVSHAIVGNLNGYVEFFSNTSNEDDAPWVATVDTGLTYGLNPDIQLDLGVNWGVTRSADDFNPFCGISIRY